MRYNGTRGKIKMSFSSTIVNGNWQFMLRQCGHDFLLPAVTKALLKKVSLLSIYTNIGN
jgi:hypothetical protein